MQRYRQMLMMALAASSISLIHAFSSPLLPPPLRSSSLAPISPALYQTASKASCTGYVVCQPAMQPPIRRLLPLRKDCRSFSLKMTHFTSDASRSNAGLMALKDILAGLPVTAGYTSWQELFSKFDIDKSGYLDGKELKNALRSLGGCVPDERVDYILKSLDSDGDGVISWLEFESMLELIQ
eukprot:81738-Hanusia_phi.AAC.1